MQSYEGNDSLPRDWRLLPLGEVAVTQSCNSKLIKGRLSSEPAEGLFPAFSASGQDVWCSPAQHKGDAVIISAVGARCGKCFFARGEWSAIANTHILWPKPDVVDAQFLWRLVNDEEFWIRGQSAQPFVQVGASKEKGVVVPPLDEQRKIAGVLGLVQRAMEQQERLLALTAELKKTLLHQLFTHGLHNESQKQTEIGFIPENWQVSTMEQMGEVVYGIQAAVASNLKPVGPPILTNKNIALDGGFDLEKMNYFELKTARHKATLLKKGDILFNWRSGSKEHVGKTALFDLDGDYTHSSFILRIRPRDPITGRFLFYFLNWLRGSSYFVKRHSFAVNAKFNKSAINQLMVAFPEPAESAEIVNTLDTASAKEQLHRRKHAALSSLFRTLLHELMTARIRVHNLDLSALEMTAD